MASFSWIYFGFPSQAPQASTTGSPKANFLPHAGHPSAFKLLSFSRSMMVFNRFFSRVGIKSSFPGFGLPAITYKLNAGCNMSSGRELLPVLQNRRMHLLYQIVINYFAAGIFERLDCDQLNWSRTDGSCLFWTQSKYTLSQQDKGRLRGTRSPDLRSDRGAVL